jgi:hypothetical protein
MRRYKTSIIISITVLFLMGAFACLPAATGSDFTITSSVNYNHSHDITIKGANIDNPPSAPIIITSTNTGNPPHTHTVTLSKADYQSLKDGKTVTVECSSAGNHTHTFNIKRP